METSQVCKTVCRSLAMTISYAFAKTDQRYYLTSDIADIACNKCNALSAIS